MQPRDISAVVCTKNSITGIQRCLTSLREAGVGELIVVDAHSTDGTREVAETIADRILQDPGTGLGRARNLGIAQTSGSLILNMGSDNVMPPRQCDLMIRDLVTGGFHGVSARTVIEGCNYTAQGLNAWRSGRFVPGPAPVIGTPTLFHGDALRASPYDADRMFSDDSELCERWSSEFGATFAISQAYVLEIGKGTWSEVVVRCQMYGISDAEIYRSGSGSGWSRSRKTKSILHPLRSDFFVPLQRLSWPKKVTSAPFLAAFTAMRYGYWARTAAKKAS